MKKFNSTLNIIYITSFVFLFSFVVTTIISNI